jgi:hypothetical protein
MPLTIPPALEEKLRHRADAAGISVESYIERIADEDRQSEAEWTSLITEGLTSGAPLPTGPDYWAEKHHRLTQRLAAAGQK